MHEIFEGHKFSFSKFTQVATCLGKSCCLGFSPVILLFVGMCLSIFPFDIWDKLWVLIRSVPEVSGWSGGAMVLGKLPVPGRPTILITVGQGPTALAVGAGGGGLDIFTLIYPFSSFSLSLGDGPI